MTILILLCSAWFMVLGLWVVLKLRQPKLAYPTPPQAAASAEEKKAA